MRCRYETSSRDCWLHSSLGMGLRCHLDQGEAFMLATDRNKLIYRLELVRRSPKSSRGKSTLFIEGWAEPSAAVGLGLRDSKGIFLTLGQWMVLKFLVEGEDICRKFLGAPSHATKSRSTESTGKGKCDFHCG
jgi:hypothetical protein